MTRGKAVRVLFLAALAAATGALFVRVLRTATVTASPCGTVPPVHGLIPAGVLAGAAITSFVVGGFFGAWRTVAAGESESESGDLAVHTVLVVVLAITAVALGYETYALATPGVWPITYYVRCANVVAPWWTLLGLASVCGLLGHWLWQPLARYVAR
jgi:hypothetical protein